MKQNKPRADYNVDKVGFTYLGAIASVLAVITGIVLLTVGLFTGPTLLAGIITAAVGVLAIGAMTYPFYHVILAPEMYDDDSNTVNHSYQLVKNAKRLAKDPDLKGEAAAKVTISALKEDHRHLLQLGKSHYQDRQQGLAGHRTQFDQLRKDMIETYQALQTLRDEKRLLAQATRNTSRSALRLLKEETQSTKDTRTYLNKETSTYTE